MADIDKLIPHIIRWEAGVKQLYGESLERLFERARRPGYAYDPDDKGGHTQTGITLNTYIRFRKFAGRSKGQYDKETAGRTIWVLELESCCIIATYY